LVAYDCIVDLGGTVTARNVIAFAPREFLLGPYYLIMAEHWNFLSPALIEQFSVGFLRSETSADNEMWAWHSSLRKFITIATPVMVYTEEFTSL